MSEKRRVMKMNVDGWEVEEEECEIEHERESMNDELTSNRGEWKRKTFCADHWMFRRFVLLDLLSLLDQ
ncbi:unnamed protein product, partial [Brenthis ino]